MNDSLVNSADGHQQWEDDGFCDAYEATWEISVQQVHYGWLADGEHELGLLRDIRVASPRVLDIGCGLGQNLISQAKDGATCVGVDISPCMLSKAQALIDKEGVADSIELIEGDMRDLSAHIHDEFDLILSVYSMEYLTSIQQLRAVVHDIHKRLIPGGIFVLCFTHPSQAHRYPEFMNCSVPLGAGKYRTFNYSVKDATEALFKSDFSIERMVEQITKDPSKISYEEGRKFPYHFREGCNPCTSEYDEISNGAPHTIIYKCRRQHDARKGYFERQIVLDVGYRELWGVKRKIEKHSKISYLGYGFDCLRLAPRDNVVGIVDVVNVTVSVDEVKDSSGVDIELMTSDGNAIVVPSSSVLGVIHRRLKRLDLEPIYKTFNVDTPDRGMDREVRVLLVGVSGLDELVSAEFDTTKIGLLTFLDGKEPAKGELPIDMIMAVPGERISLVYVALRERQGSNRKHQIEIDI